MSFKEACLCSVLLLFQGRRGCLLKLRWQLPAGPRCGGGKRRVPYAPHPPSSFPSRPDCCSPSLCSDTTTAESRGETRNQTIFYLFDVTLLQRPWVTCPIKRLEPREKLSEAFIYSLFKLIFACLNRHLTVLCWIRLKFGWLRPRHSVPTRRQLKGGEIQNQAILFIRRYFAATSLSDMPN